MKLREIEVENLRQEEEYFENLFRSSKIFNNDTGSVNRIKNIGHSQVEKFMDRKKKLDDERDEL